MRFQEHGRGKVLRAGRKVDSLCAGISTLEFIVILPSFLFVLLAGIELSRAWMSLNVVTAAAWEGARVGAVTTPWSATPAINRANAILAAGNISGGTVTVTCSGGCVTDSQVTATVTWNFQTLFPLALPMLGTIPLSNTAVMRYEGP